jgi:thiamine pyrophosphokinase
MSTNSCNSNQIVFFLQKVTLLGGGACESAALKHALTLAPHLICADGGANLALDAGLMPEMIIGDLDSLLPQHRAAYPDIILHMDNQDSTDFEKCLESISAPAILCLGFLGKRLDHTLAAMTALARYPDQKAILLGEEDICFLCPSELSLSLPKGTRISLYPLSPVTGRSTGLVWPIDGLTLTPDGTISTSNETRAARVLLSDITGKLLVIVPKQHLEPVLHRL